MANKNFKLQFLKNIKYSFIYMLYINKMVGKIIKRGHKDWALKFFANLKYELKKIIKIEPKVILFVGLINGMIPLGMLKKRFGGTMKDIPSYVNDRKQVINVIKLILKNSKGNLKLIDFNKLLNNLKLLSENKGFLITHNQKIYKTALENRVFLKISGKKN